MKRLAFPFTSLAMLLLGLPLVGGTSVLSFPGHPRPHAANLPDAGRVPVVVELFTSEGCSSCPAADEALRELETSQPVPGVEVLALGQHVDYWNRLGWKDAFSSPQFTQRQRAYAEHFGSGSYTPQAVVNGRVEFVGSRRQQLAEAVANAATAPRATVRLTSMGPTLNVQVANLPSGTQQADVLLVFTETGLSSQVGRGENSGRLLRHAAVVRELRPLGSIPANGTFTASPALQLNPHWNRAHLRAVVLVQEQASGHIVGVASLPLGAAATAAN